MLRVTSPAEVGVAVPRDCQVVQAPHSDQRLVTQHLTMPPGGIDGEIRLTYRELTALIEDAVRALK